MTNPRNSDGLLKPAVDRPNEHLQLLFVDDSAKTLEYYYPCSMLPSTWRVLLRARTSLEDALSPFLPGAHEIHNAVNVYRTMVIVCVCVRDAEHEKPLSQLVWRAFAETTQSCVFIFSLALPFSFSLSLFLSFFLLTFGSTRIRVCSVTEG